MIRTGLAAALLLSSMAVPALAQERVLTVFGDDKCPENTICVRAREEERYRIPKHLRQPLPSPDTESWAVRSQATLSEGKTGTGSCTAVGGGGWTGCFAEEMRRAREEAEAKRQNKPELP